MNDTLPALGQYIEPAPVPFTFGAPGWDAVAIAAGVLLAAGLLLYLHHRRLNRYRREALRLVEAMDPADEGTVYRANMLIKRICMALYPRAACAPLRGGEWFAFLNATLREALFDQEDIRLTEAIYTTHTAAGSDLFLQKTKKWIKRHRRAARPGQ